MSFKYRQRKKPKRFKSGKFGGNGFSVLCERYRPENVSSNQSSTLVAVCEVTQSCCYQTLDKLVVLGLVKIYI